MRFATEREKKVVGDPTEKWFSAETGFSISISALRPFVSVEISIK